MEYAEQTLAQLLPHRALTPDETRELLLPALEALAYLHGKHLVQGQLKPSNVLVVDDLVKLASDTVRPAGESAAGMAEPSLYDSPESKDGRISAAGDVWALGVTIVEALTQRPPTWPDARRENVSLPATLPPLFADIARRCLSRYPAGRPSITGLVAQIKRAAQVRGTAVAGAPATDVAAIDAAATEAAVAEAPVTKAAAADLPVTEVAVPKAAAAAETLVSKPALTTAAPSEAAESEVGVSAAAANGPPKRPIAAELPAAKRMPARAVASWALVVLVVIWVCWRLVHGHLGSAQPASSHPQSSLQQAAPAPAPAQNPPMAATTPAVPAVLHQEIPDVSRHARDSIRGRIKVTVRVTVDRSGNVVGQRLVNSGSSKYFARLASAAAGKWKFTPDKQGSRTWLLEFDFSRGGVVAHAAAAPT
jgi:TonB family protein